MKDTERTTGRARLRRPSPVECPYGSWSMGCEKEGRAVDPGLDGWKTVASPPDGISPAMRDKADTVEDGDVPIYIGSGPALDPGETDIPAATRGTERRRFDPLRPFVRTPYPKSE